MELLQALLGMLRIDVLPSYTTEFKSVESEENDLRYKITPKIKSAYAPKEYLQVFDAQEPFNPGLSIIDLVFNTGPEARLYI